MAWRREQALACPSDLPFPTPPRDREELVEQHFEIVPAGNLPTREADDAKSHWREWPAKPWYRTRKPYVDAIAKRIADLEPASTLEFGCNVGRNLLGVVERVPEVLCVGLDINANAIASGRVQTGLDLRVGDVMDLWSFEEGQFDVVFTVSVLDHIVDIDEACQALVHCAARAVLCVEVRLPVEGRVIRHFDHRRRQPAPSTAASYSWDVAERLRRHERTWRLDERPIYLHASALGPYYTASLAHLDPPADTCLPPGNLTADERPNT
jgi:SAM-dependent methyltransferase